ncbi:MAG: FAD-dependent monooxygenase, partial [Bdellovibrionota bacterium]|nr:FAD-dependent monooxygenase [Bdellovibrionota bacterium]
MSRYDVIISGGGPVGSLGALLLAEQGFKVAIIEESKQVYPYPRAVSMDAFSLQTVKRLIGKRFDDFPTTPLHRAYYVLDRKDLTAPFAYAEVNDPHLSFVNWFEQPILESFLRETIKENNLIDSFYGHSALSIFSNDEGVHLRHMDSETGKIELVSGSYLLGCDGGGSMIRKQVGVSQSQLGASTLFLIVDCK